MAGIGLPPPPVDLLVTRRPQPSADVSGVKTRQQAELVAKQFERMFISEMLQPMFAGIQTDGPFGGGTGEEVFRPMLLDQYADAVAKGHGVGIADAVLKEILRLQGLE